VNGKTLEDVTQINHYLFMRDVKNISVLHQSGNKETIQIPENIGTTMFESGVLRPFSPINKPIIDSTYLEIAEKAGLKKGDRITEVNGKPIQYWHEFRKTIHENKGAPISINYIRNSETNSTSITPNEDGLIGVVVKNSFKVQEKKYSFGGSITKGFDFGYWTLHDYIAQFKYVFTKKGASQVGGFGAIGNLFPDVWNWRAFWGTTAFISIILAFMNILPIPALDGGHVMFLLYEIIAGRKPNDKFMEYAQLAGFILLIALLLFANGNDIYRAIFDK
jgi:regulator of sigma E protease